MADLFDEEVLQLMRGNISRAELCLRVITAERKLRELEREIPEANARRDDPGPRADAHRG